MVDEIEAQYYEVLAEYDTAAKPQPEMEGREAAAYLRWLSIQTHSNPSARASLKTVLSRIPILNSPQVTDLILRLASKLASSRRQRNGVSKGES